MSDGWQYTIHDFTPHSVAWVIQRFIEDMASPEMKQLGRSQRYTLGVIQRMPIGAKRAATLKKSDIAEFARELRKTRAASTVNQYIGYLSTVFKHASSAWDDCEDVTIAPIEAARPFLVRNDVIGKSMPRKRVPTDEELDALLAYYATPNKHGRARKLPMPDIIAFALASTRRIGEICRIMHGDIDWGRTDGAGNATPMYMVRDLKHPKKKKGNNKWFPLFPELAEIIRRQPRVGTSPTERVFPYSSQSASASYTRAKKALHIEGLRFHDNRREAITRWLAKLKNPHKVKLISGHETTQILEKVYDATDPAILHGDMRAQA